MNRFAKNVAIRLAVRLASNNELCVADKVM